jgi:hypothetical protein
MLSPDRPLQAASPNAVKTESVGPSRGVAAAGPRPDAGLPVVPNSGPRDGDVLVTCEATSRVRFTIRQLPAVVQLSASSRDEAVRLARAFAQRHAVDVWYSEKGALRLLEAYRARTSAVVQSRATRTA